MGKQVEVVVLEVLRETDKAMRVRLFAQASYGSTDIVEWLPKSLLTRMPVQSPLGTSYLLPLWKAAQIERSLPYGTVVCLEVEGA